jgi:flagellar motility protein MotE (MotC chaperone)
VRHVLNRLPRLVAPRILPPTIVAMALVLGLRSVELVRAAVPAQAAASSLPPGATAPAQAAPPVPSPSIASAGQPEPAPAASGAPNKATAPTAPVTTATSTAPVSTEPPISDGERAVLLDLRARRTELDAREAALASRESVLAAAEARLAARVKELSDLQARLQALEARRAERDEANWRGLVKLYESMKPRDAATIFNDLDLPVLVPILDRMKEAKAAAILGAMQPERARLVTAELAQARARANAVPAAGATPTSSAPAPSGPAAPAKSGG